MGFADGAVGLRPLRARVQHHRGRALRNAAANRQSLQRRREWVFLVRPRPLRVRIRERAGADSEAAVAPRGDARCGDGGRSTRALWNPSRFRHRSRGPRLAARFARSELRLAQLGWRRAFLFGCWRTRASPDSPRARNSKQGNGSDALARRDRKVRRRARSR